jgi:hypothetical protein
MDTPEYLQSQARKCRSLASTTFNEKLAKMLLGMADEYEQKAQLLFAGHKAVAEPESP